MRTITLIIVHCTANKAGSTLRMADIDRYHRSLGWKGCGYHYVIPTDGTIECGRPEERIGAHCRNHNRHSIGVAYVGGLADDGKTPCDTRTEAQKRALRQLLGELHKRYPKALIVGHSDLDPHKPHCPGFKNFEFWILNFELSALPMLNYALCAMLSVELSAKHQLNRHNPYSFFEYRFCWFCWYTGSRRSIS